MPALEVRAHATCKSCAQPVPFNALVLKAACPNCDTPTAVSEDDWKWVLARQPSEDTPRPDPIESLVEWRKSPLDAALRGEVTPDEPSCIACKASIPPQKDGEYGLPAACACGAPVRARKPPLGFPGASAWVAIVGEDETSSEAVAKREVVVVPCPQCGGPLRVDGSKRSPHCDYCASRVFLPDAVWRELRPTQIRPWFLWISDAELAARRSAAAAVAAAAAREDAEEERKERRASALLRNVALTLTIAGNGVVLAGGLTAAWPISYFMIAIYVLVFAAFERLRLRLEHADKYWWASGAIRYRAGRIATIVLLSGIGLLIGWARGDDSLLGAAGIGGFSALMFGIAACAMPEDMTW